MMKLQALQLECMFACATVRQKTGDTRLDIALQENRKLVWQASCLKKDLHYFNVSERAYFLSSVKSKFK